MLCFVVIAEEVAAASRGWASGALSAMNYTGAGIASLIFAAVNFLPYGWRAIYVIGALPLFLVAYLRRRLPETERFAVQEGLASTPSKFAETLGLLRDLAGKGLQQRRFFAFTRTGHQQHCRDIQPGRQFQFPVNNHSHRAFPRPAAISEPGVISHRRIRAHQYRRFFAAPAVYQQICMFIADEQP